MEDDTLNLMLKKINENMLQYVTYYCVKIAYNDFKLHSI